MIGTVALLCGLLAAQQWFYMREIQKLVDKLMSRDFGEYNRIASPQPKLKVKLPEGIPEDLGALKEFTSI